MTKLPGKSHTQHSRDAAKAILAAQSGNASPDDKELDELADAIEAKTEEAVAEVKANKDKKAKEQPQASAPKK